MRIRLGVLCLLLTATTASAQSLEQQGICAKQAKVAFEDWENASRKESPNLHQHFEYQSHYNTKLNKCFIDIQVMIVDGNVTTGDTLMDAFEQRVNAQRVSAGMNSSCDLIPKPQDKRTCSSKDEYDAFVARYMEE